MKAEPVEAALQQLVAAVAVLPEVRSIGLSGGDRPLPRPGEGDLDLFVYCTAIPAPDRRRSALETLPDLARDIDAGRSQGGPWGRADSLWLAGVETWLMHFQAGEARQELADLLAGRLRATPAGGGGPGRHGRDPEPLPRRLASAGRRPERPGG